MLKLKTILLMIATLVLLTACGKGETPGTVRATVSGVASKGPIYGAIVTVTDLSGKTVGTGTTNSDGSFSVDLPDYKGPVIVKITGGGYVDEETGEVVNLSAAMPNGLRAAFGNASGATRVIVTPLTEIAVQMAVAQGALSRTSVTNANSAVSTAFGIDDIASTLPLTSAGLPSTTLSYSDKYANALVNISKLVQAQANKTVTEVIDAYFAPGTINSDGSWAGGAAPADYTTANADTRLTLWPSKPSAFITGDSIALYAKGGSSNADPNLATKVTFTITGSAVFVDNSLKSKIQGTGVDQQSGIDVATTSIRATGSGSVTIKATLGPDDKKTAFTAVSFVDKTGDSTITVRLTQAGIDLLGGQQVKAMKFNIVNNNGSVASLLEKVTDNVGFTFVEQNGATTTQVIMPSNAGKTVTQPMLELRYGYNPTPPSFTVTPVGVVTLADDSTVTLTSDHFQITSI